MLAGVFVLWAVAIVARLVYLQVLTHEELVARAERQQLRTITAPAKRGEIFDRNGRLLAYSVDADTIYAVPNDIADARSRRRRSAACSTDCDRKDREALAARLVT